MVVVVVTDLVVVVLNTVEVVHHMITAADLTQEVVHLHSDQEVTMDVGLTTLLPVIETLSLVDPLHVAVITPQEIAPLLNIATVIRDLHKVVVINEMVDTTE